MINYKKLPGKLAPQGAPGIVTTPEGLAMGHIPGWAMLIDPGYLHGPRDLINRALPRNLATNPANDIPIDAFANGQPAVRPVTGQAMRVNTDVSINPDMWSIFTVARYVENNTGAKGLLINSSSEQSGVIAPQIGFSQGGSNAIIWENSMSTAGQPQRLNVEVGLAARTQPALIMFTFSVREGLRTFVDGVQVGAAPDDKRPLKLGYQAGEWEMFRFLRSLWGMTGLLNIGLGWPEHAGYRHAIERFLMTKYGLAF